MTRKCKFALETSEKWHWNAPSLFYRGAFWSIDAGIKWLKRTSQVNTQKRKQHEINESRKDDDSFSASSQHTNISLLALLRSFLWPIRLIPLWIVYLYNLISSSILYFSLVSDHHFYGRPLLRFNRSDLHTLTIDWRPNKLSSRRRLKQKNKWRKNMWNKNDCDCLTVRCPSSM